MPDSTPSRRPEAPRPSLARRLRGIAIQVLLVIAVIWGVSAWQTRRLLDNHDAAAPAFELRDLDGRVVRLADLRGKAVMVHFWATWCGVCRLEHGALNAVHGGLDADEALVSIVADSDDADALRRYVEDKGIEYPVLLADEAVVAQYRVGAFPTNYFLRPDGTISSTSVGLSTRFSLAARLGWAAR